MNLRSRVAPFLFVFGVFLVLPLSAAVILLSQVNKSSSTASAAGCTIDSATVSQGGVKAVRHNGFASSESIRIFGTGAQQELGVTSSSLRETKIQNMMIPLYVPNGSYNIVIVTRYPSILFACSGGPFSVTTPTPTPPPPPPTSPPATTKYDVNGDGKVDCTDVKLVLSKVGTRETKYDMDGNGAVTIADVSIIQTKVATTC